MNQSTCKGSCVVIGVGTFPDAKISAVLFLSRAEGDLATLDGLFVTDDRLYDLLSHPGPLLATGRGRQCAPRTFDRMCVSFDSDIRAFRQLITTLAQSTDTEFRSKTQHSSLALAVEETTQDWDILLLGQQSLHRYAGDYVPLNELGPLGSTLLALAEALARTLYANLRSLDQQKADRQPEEALNLMNPAAVVHSLPTNTTDLGELLNIARCPVVLPRTLCAEPEDQDKI